METQTAEADGGQQLPQGHSRWDRLPMEIRLHVMGFASLLTRYINGLVSLPPSPSQPSQPPSPASINKPARSATGTNDPAMEMARLLWTEALEMDWHGDLGKLPDVSLGVDGIGDIDMALVQSRSMYLRLCARFPHQCDRADDARWYRAWNTYDVVSSDWFINDRLHHIPMRHSWFDLLDLRHPVAFGWIAILFGYTGLLRHLDAHGLAHIRLYAKCNYLAVMDVAASRGHVDVLAMLHRAGNAACTKSAMDWAARNGHRDVVEFLHAHRSEGCDRAAMNWAAENGHLGIVQFLHANRTEGCTTHAVDLAAIRGHMDVVVWLSTHRSEGFTADAIKGAARFGHVGIVEYLVQLVTRPAVLRDAIEDLVGLMGNGQAHGGLERVMAALMARMDVLEGPA